MSQSTRSVPDGALASVHETPCADQRSSVFRQRWIGATSSCWSSWSRIQRRVTAGSHTRRFRARERSAAWACSAIVRSRVPPVAALRSAACEGGEKRGLTEHEERTDDEAERGCHDRDCGVDREVSLGAEKAERGGECDDGIGGKEASDETDQ